MDQENKITKLLENSYIEDIGGNKIPIQEQEHLEDFNENNEKDVKEEGNWVEFNDNNLQEFVDNFTHYADDNNIDFDKFDFSEYPATYYAEKFPGFDPEIHEILAECSKKRIEDFRKAEKDKFIQKEKGDFVVKFD